MPGTSLNGLWSVSSVLYLVVRGLMLPSYPNFSNSFSKAIRWRLMMFLVAGVQWLSFMHFASLLGVGSCPLSCLLSCLTIQVRFLVYGSDIPWSILDFKASSKMLFGTTTSLVSFPDQSSLGVHPRSMARRYSFSRAAKAEYRKCWGNVFGVDQDPMGCPL